MNEKELKAVTNQVVRRAFNKAIFLTPDAETLKAVLLKTSASLKTIAETNTLAQLTTLRKILSMLGGECL